MSIHEWDNKWHRLGFLSKVDRSELRGWVGLYKAVLNNQIMYVGRAVEYNNGGLAKRLADYIRESDSGRKHQSGQLMHNNAEHLVIYVLKVGNDSEAAQKTKELEHEFIEYYNPPWNVMP